MAQQIIAVGSPRTGTAHIAMLYRHLFKFNGMEGVSLHQGMPEGTPDILNRDVNYFNASWILSKRMSDISEKYPFVKFIILYRNPVATMSSLSNYYRIKGHPDAKLNPDELMKKYWLDVYEAIIEAIHGKSLEPLLLNYDCYAAQLYNRLLLRIYGIEPNRENLECMHELFQKRVNTYPQPYEPVKISSTLYDRALFMIDRLKTLCQKP